MLRPQTNGQVESANKIVLSGIKKKIEGAKGTWDEVLPKILWAMSTIVKDAIGYTPFSLVYGSDAILPVEIGIPSTRIAYYSHHEKDNVKRVFLDLLPETRGNALLSTEAKDDPLVQQIGQAQEIAAPWLCPQKK